LLDYSIKEREFVICAVSVWSCVGKICV